MIKSGTTKICVITDVHHRDDIASQYWNIIMSDAHWRQFSTAEARLTDAIDQANASGCQVFVQLGDIIDSGNSDPDALLRLAECAAITDTFNGDVIYVVGNHDSGEFGAAIETDFWGTVENGHNHVRRNNPYNTSYGYTYDCGPYRFVAMWAFGGDGDVAEAQLDWLYKGDGSGVLETTLNCIVLSHAVVYVDGIHNTQVYDSVGNSSAVIERFEAAGNVILVMSGHFHRNGIDGYDNQFLNEHNGITYLALRGSILGKNNGTEDNGTTDDSAYWVIELEDTGNTVEITITGYKQGSSDTSSVTKQKYLVA